MYFQRLLVQGGALVLAPWGPRKLSHEVALSSCHSASALEGSGPGVCWPHLRGSGI